MYNSDTEMLFPSRVIPTLRELRGKLWRELVDRAMSTAPTDLDHMAFVLLMIRLDGCESCHADSFRAMRGCTQCAQQSVRRFRGDDRDLVELFEKAREDVQMYLSELAQAPAAG